MKKHILYFSACVASALLAGVALTACNKDGDIEPGPGGENGPQTPQQPFDGVKVYEYMPAPGQFINESVTLTTRREACEWAESRLNEGKYVSLGSFGGFLVVGLDHSIKAHKSGYDFYITGNAFLSNMGGSNEPGIVWVMQDTNGNHLPDDLWYELAGSDSDLPETIRNFSVTYYRPAAPATDTPWTASDGSSGAVKYLGMFHSQNYYYPAWVDADSYTLTGTRLSSKNSLDSETGYWNNAAYGWGYADNVGADNLTGNGQRTGFKISNAVKADGSKIQLEYIDFVKIQTGVLADSGALGEISTEVCGFGELPDQQ